MNDGPAHWERAAGALGESRHRLWRDHSDAINLRLLGRWLDGDPGGRVLKTDLFDEAVGRGLCADTRARFPCLTGIDVSLGIVRLARHSTTNLAAAVADVRRLPFGDGVFDAVVSISTLDHFETAAEIVVSLREIHRTLCPGGRLVLTLDNPANPKILVRNALPWTLLRRTGIVPYFVGKSFGPRRLRRELSVAGFEVTDVGAIVHCPRVLAVAVSRLRMFRSPRARARFLEALGRFEVLADWPTRFLTGHFTVLVARRKPI